MGRLLGLVLLVFLIWLCLRAVLRFLQAPMAPSTREDPRSLPVETLVRCAACGVYFPAERTLPGERAVAYCSETCRRRSEPASTVSPS